MGDGCLNENLDRKKRINVSWSDTDPDEKYLDITHLERMICGNCKGWNFQVLSIPGQYETLAKCTRCGWYHIAHAG